MGIDARYLQDKNKNRFYPFAHADASFDRNGVKVGVRLDDIETAISSTLITAKNYTDLKISDLINGAPETLDTLKEIADALEDNENIMNALDAAIGLKANASDLTAHIENNIQHITALERMNWNLAKMHTDSVHAPINAEVNQNAYSNIRIGDFVLEASSKMDTLIFENGENVNFVVDDIFNKIIISAHSTGLKVGSSAIAKKNESATNGNVFLNVLDGNIIRDSHKIVGSGSTVVTSDSNGIITILSSGVRNISSGSVNGTISVNTDGTTVDIPIKGLGSAAYTSSDDYATAGHEHTGLSSNGNSASATKLATARKINGTLFDGTQDITTANWGTTRSFTIGTTSKNINGSANIVWTMDELGLDKVNNTADSDKNVLSSKKVLDSGNNTATTFAYSKAGLETASWLAAWNGYELRAISPSKVLSTIGAATSGHTHTFIDGTYTGNGGQQSPSYVTSGKTKFNMWNAFKGLTNPAGGYMDVILMDNYTGSDVPYVTGIGVTKNNGNPRMFIANGAKGGTGNWAYQVEAITTANIASQSVASATTATKLGTNAGSAIQPVYFSDGKPVACTYTLGKSVPSNAVFTDTNTWKANTKDQEGYVAKGSGQANKVWKTDANGNPGWRDDANSTGYLPLTGGTMTGKIQAPTVGGSWISGMTLSNATLGITTKNSSGSYHPIIACKTYNNHIWNLGTITDTVGLYGFKSGRITNGTDWSFTINVTNGTVNSTGEITAPTFNGAASKLGTATVGSANKPIYLNAGTATALSYVAIAYGGTGSTSAAGARTNLGAINFISQTTEPTSQNTGDLWFYEC